MSKFKQSPAQKRKLRIRLGVAGLAVGLLALGALGQGEQAAEARQVLQHHEVATATVTKLDHKELKYRLRRRTRTSDVFTLEYNFQVAGQTYQRTLPVDELTFLALQGQTQIEVWYKPAKPSASAPESHWRTKATHSGFLGNALGLSVFIVPGAYVLQLCLVFFFAREPKGAVPEGFVTESSWLDVDDHKLVMLDGEDLVVASFNSKLTKDVQKLYQRGADLGAILQAGAATQTRVPMAAITAIETRHHQDSFTITHGADNSSVSADFLTPAVKEHALQRVTARLALRRADEQLTRVQGAIPSGIALVVCLALAWFLQTNTGLMAVAAFAGLFALKTLVIRLIDPPRISRWTASEKRPSFRPASTS